MTALNATEKLVKDGLTLTGSATLSHTESQQAWLDGKAAFLPVGTWLENEMKKTIPADFKMKHLELLGRQLGGQGAERGLRRFRRGLDRAEEGRELRGRHGVPAARCCPRTGRRSSPR